MIDWNNNGDIDPEEFVMTAVILDERNEEAQDEVGEDSAPYSNGSESPKIGCLIGMGVFFLFFLKWLTDVIH